MKRVLVIGDLNADLILTGLSGHPRYGREVLVRGCRLSLGGSGAIFACGLARLGQPVRFLGKIGADWAGDLVLSLMRRRGVDVSGVRRDPKVGTGIAVAFTETDDRALVSYLGTVASTSGRDVPVGSWSGFSHLHLTSPFIQLGLRDRFPAILKRAKREGLTTSIDPGWDPRERWDLQAIYPFVDVILVNESEGRALSGRRRPGEAAAWLGERVPLAVVKTGPKGAVAWSKGGLVRTPAHEVETVDTTGAGDTFDAGFLWAWSGGKPVSEALALGCACGALSTRKPGGYDGQPTLGEAYRLLKRIR
jgi:sugar/nucleoside kinase (ribokinase family)